MELTELSRIFARGYLRLLKQSGQIEATASAPALDESAETALSVTRVNTVSKKERT